MNLNRVLVALIYLAVSLSYSLLLWTIWRFLLVPTFTSVAEAACINSMMVVFWCGSMIVIASSFVGGEKTT